MARTTMNSSRGVGIKLSPRLGHIRSFYQHEEVIYDIGCDHGLLGLSFSTEENVKEIHFVDPSTDVIQTLKTTLKDSYISKAHFVHHTSGQKITISSQKNCIFIAGMGGSEISEIINHLLPKLDSSSQIVISPHRNILAMRERLSKLPLTLIQETVIEDEGIFYQIIAMRPGEHSERISLYGKGLVWSGEVGKRHRDHMLTQFKRHRNEASEAFVQYLEGQKY